MPASALTLSGAQKAPINTAQKNQKVDTNPKTVALNGHRKAVVIILGISSALALTAGIVAAIFACYIVAAAAAAAFVAFSVSAIVAYKVNVSQKSLNEIEELRKKADSNQALTKEIEELKKPKTPASQTPPAQKDTPALAKNEDSKQLDDLKQKLKIAEENVEQMTKDRDTAQLVHQKLKDDIAAKKNELQDLKTAQAPKQTPTSPVLGKKPASGADVPKPDSLMKPLEEKLKASQTELQKKETELKNSQSEYLKVVQELAALKTKVAEIKAKIAEFGQLQEKQKKVYEQQLNAKEKKIGELAKRIEELQSVPKAGQPQPIALTDNDAEIKQIEKRIKGEYETRERQLRNQVAVERDKILDKRELEQAAEIKIWEGKVEALNLQVSDLKKRAEAAESALSTRAAQSDPSEPQQQVREPNEQVKLLTQQVSDLQAAILRATKNALIEREPAKPVAMNTEQSDRPGTVLGFFERHIKNFNDAVEFATKNINSELEKDIERTKSEKLSEGDKKELAKTLKILNNAQTAWRVVLEKQKNRKLNELMRDTSI